MTRYESYLEAVKFVRAAVEAFEQAVSCMKDARVRPQVTSYPHSTERRLLKDLDSLLTNLSDATCEDCDAPLAECKCPWLAAEVRS